MERTTIPNNHKISLTLKGFTRLARQSGASGARVISTGDISILNPLPAVPVKQYFAMTMLTAVCWQKMESVGILDMLDRPCPALELTYPS